VAADDKIVDRVKKLLRLAAPDSGATLGERESAAVEAAKLIAVHGVVIGGETKTETRVVYRDRPASQQPRRREPPPPGPTRMRTPFGAEYYVKYAPNHVWSWRRGVAARVATCSDPSCNGTISPGERVWERENGGQMEYLHEDGPCQW
jgi:hypothetical protein